MSDWAIYRRALAEAGPRIGSITFYVILGLLATPLNLLTPVPLKIVADSVLGDEPLPGALGSLPPEAILTFAALLSVGIALLREVQSRGSDFTKTYISEMLVLGFRARLRTVVLQTICKRLGEERLVDRVCGALRHAFAEVLVLPLRERL